MIVVLYIIVFSHNYSATTEIYTLSLHDALPIYRSQPVCSVARTHRAAISSNPRRTARDLLVLETRSARGTGACSRRADRKSTRMNSSHPSISYAVFCLKKKNTTR